MEEEYIDLFNELFGTTIKDAKIVDKIKLLETLYKDLGDKLYVTTEEYQNLTNKYVEKADEFTASLTDEQEELFDGCNEILNEMNYKTELQMFIFGYMLADKLK